VLNNKVLLLVVIMVLGAVLRFAELDLRSLWYDEVSKISSANLVRELPDYVTHRHAKKPGFIPIIKIWMYFFGETEIVVRSLSVLLGICSLVLFYLLASSLLSQSCGLVSSFLLAISPFHIYYSQQVTEYSFSLVLVLLSTLLFVQLCKKEHAYLYCLYALVSFYHCLTQLSGIFIIVIHCLWLYFISRSFYRKKGWQLTLVSLVIFLIPFYTFVFLRGQEANKVFWIERPTVSVILETFKALSYGGGQLAHGGVGFIVDKKLLNYAWWLTPLFSVLVLFGLGFFNVSKKTSHDTTEEGLFTRKSISILLVMWVVVPLLINFVFSLLIIPIYVVRYFMNILPAYLMLIAIGVVSCKKKFVITTVISLIFVLNVQALYVYYQPPEIASWREIVKRIREEILPHDIVYFVPSEQIITFTYYFSENPGQTFRTVDIKGKRINGEWHKLFEEDRYIYAGIPLRHDTASILTSNQFKEYEQQAERIFFVASPYWPGVDDNVSRTREYFANNGWQEEEYWYPYPGVQLYIYTNRNTRIL